MNKFISIINKILRSFIKAVASILLILIIAVAATSISPIYDFKSPTKFEGADIYNPYRGFDAQNGWKRANFHTHTRVKGIMNECEYWPADVYNALERFGYDIVTFSNHNELTVHPFDTSLQVDVYEHGYNLLKYHKLVFGCDRVKRFDHLLPVFAFQRQFQLDILGKDSDFIQLNHPLRTEGTSKEMMEVCLPSSLARNRTVL